MPLILHIWGCCNFKTMRPVRYIYFQSLDRHVYSATVNAYLCWITRASHSIVLTVTSRKEKHTINVPFTKYSLAMNLDVHNF